MAITPEDILAGADLDAWRDFTRDLSMKGCTDRTTGTYGESLVSLARWLARRGDPGCSACLGTGQVHAGRSLEERCAECGPVSLLDAGRDDLTRYLTWVRESHTTICRGRDEPCAGHTGTQSVRYRSLRRFWKFLAAEDICADAMARVPVPMGQVKAVQSIRDADVGALLDACAGKDHDSLRDTAIIQLWMEAGCPRASEISGLLDADADLGRDLALIRGKGRKQRMIVLSPATARAISRYRRARARRKDAAEFGELFLGLKGRMTRWGINQMLDRRCEQAGIAHLHPHQFRHASSVAARRAGLPDTVIAHLNGWTTTRMMEIYGAAAEGELAIETARTAGLGGRLAKAAR